MYDNTSICTDPVLSRKLVVDTFIPSRKEEVSPFSADKLRGLMERERLD